MPNSYTALNYHIIFSTKNREPCITNDFRNELYKYIGSIILNKNGTLIEIGGIENHVHILMKNKATLAISDLLRFIKCNSSKWINEQQFQETPFDWQDGYGAFTVSQSQITKTQNYIRNQKVHHKHMTFEDEIISFMKKTRNPLPPKIFITIN